MTFNIKNSNQSYKIAAELSEISSSAGREFVKNLLVGFAHQNNFHKISTFIQIFERIYNSQLNRGVATIEASILGETSVSFTEINWTQRFARTRSRADQFIIANKVLPL